MMISNNIRKMIRSYLGLLTVFVLQHQVPCLSADLEQMKQTQNMKKYMMTELQNIQRRMDIREDPLDNYDLIVTQRSESLAKPRRHRHGHHRLRSGRGAKVIKNDAPHTHLKLKNTLRKNFNPTEENNLTLIHSDANAKTRNYLDEHDKGRENGATTQKEKDTAMKNDLSKQRRGIENETITEKQMQANVATISYDNEPQERAEEKSATTIQKDKNVTKNMKKSYLSENIKAREIEAITKIERNKDSTMKNYLNELQREKTQIQSKQSAVMKNNLNHEQRNEGENEAMTKINKNGTVTNYNIENWREEEKIATTSQKPVKTKQNVTPKVPFYRRINYLNDQERNKPQKWVHCLDLVAPRLKGYNDNGRAIHVTSHSSIIKRLAELLTTDVSKYTESEIIALLSQISNIDFRLFQWHFSAITTVINIIIQEPVHSFRKLKAGIKFLFRRWHLDTSMLKMFLEQTRIIRPPCIDISGMSDFTKKGGSILFTKPDKSTKKPRGGDESCHSLETTTVNNDND